MRNRDVGRFGGMPETRKPAGLSASGLSMVGATGIEPVTPPV